MRDTRRQVHGPGCAGMRARQRRRRNRKTPPQWYGARVRGFRVRGKGEPSDHLDHDRTVFLFTAFGNGNHSFQKQAIPITYTDTHF